MDTFKNKRVYGDIEELKNSFSEFGIKEIEFAEVNEAIKLSRLMQLTFKNSALFYGKK